MDQSPLLKLPYVMAAQAQKHITHNEAIRSLDAIVQLAVLDRDIAEPPADPADGDRYIVAADGEGDWAGHDGKVAAWQDGAWAVYEPVAGWIAWVADEAVLLCWDGEAWIAPAAGGSLNPTSLVGINTTADETNRLAVASEAVLFSHDGDGHQLKINKAATADTGSLLFQTDWVGHAELGLAGNDAFSIKVSADGSDWITALKVDQTTGRIGAGVTTPAAVLHAKAPSNGDYLFRFDDAGGSNLVQARFDGTNIQYTWGARVYHNFTGTGGLQVVGGSGLRADQCRILPSPAQISAGTHGLRIGDGGAESYATSADQLTRPNMSFRAWAWNGTNGFSLGTYGWFGLEQTAATNGAAKFFWRLDGIANTSRMELDHHGNLGAAGAITAATFAKVGTYTVSTLPDPSAAGAGAIVFVSDESGGAVLAFSDGTDWRRVTDRAAVS